MTLLNQVCAPGVPELYLEVTWDLCLKCTFLRSTHTDSNSICLEWDQNIHIFFFFFWLHWVFVGLRRLLIAVASLVAEHGL